MNTLHIELVLIYDISDGEEILSSHISEVIESNETEFHERMARVCSKYDMRAMLLDETLQVHDINLSSSGGVASVEYDYDAYYGCKDIDHSDGVEDDWEFALVGKKIIFDLELPEIERYDEI